MTAPGPLLVGLAVGGGTGPELADLFRRAVAALADPREIEFAVASHRFRTFGEVLHGESDGDGAEHAAREDARIYEAFLRDLRRRGGRVVFRTAFNAHSLYRVRERLMAVRVEMLPLPEGELLLVRDATQGFYGGDNTTPDGQDEIRRTCRFSRDSTRRVLAFAVAEAVAHYGVGAPLDHAVVAYKFHVLGPASRAGSSSSRRSPVSRSSSGSPIPRTATCSAGPSPGACCSSARTSGPT